MVILVLSGSFGSSTSSTFIFRGNYSRIFRWAGMVFHGLCMVILVLFSSSTS